MWQKAIVLGCSCLCPPPLKHVDRQGLDYLTFHSLHTRVLGARHALTSVAVLVAGLLAKRVSSAAEGE